MKYLVLVLIFCFCGCNTSKNAQQGISTVEIDTLYSNQLNRNIPYRVYLPGNYHEKEIFPVLYLLHGHGGNDDDWFTPEEGHVNSILDSLIDLNKIPPLVAVTMDAGNSWYVDSKERMESAYIQDFMPFIESKYKVIKEERSRIIAGNSAGGYGALRLSLKFPQLFRSSILLSPAAYNPLPPEISSSRKVVVFEKNGVFNDSIWASYAYTNLIDSSPSKRVLPKFYVSTGDDDKYDIFTVVSRLRTFFKEHGIDHEIIVTDGGHSWEVWCHSFARDLVRIINENPL